MAVSGLEPVMQQTMIRTPGRETEKFYQTTLGCGGQENRPMAHQTVFTWARLMGSCATSSARVHSAPYVKLCKMIPGRGLWNSFLYRHGSC